MARPRKGTHRVPTDERILCAAEVSFAALGFEGAKLADIASDAGIRRPSLLYHFGTKDALYGVVVQRIVADLKDALILSFSEDGTYEERVLALMATFVGFAEGRPAFAPLVLRGVMDGRGPMRDIIGRELVPLLDLVENWLQMDSEGSRLPGVDVRSAVLHLCSNALLRSASGTLRTPVWGEGIDTSIELARVLFLGKGASAMAS